ncbi:MAG: hypothetical protein KatS3mg010_2091 [Acidimicrobiia bacterium]|nr:MAG: hypothetical protein KatS3mg010_2091 [Acidimicrobiia bacterium]
MPSSRRYFNKLMLARLHAELSRCMYSLHGLDALMRPVLEAVCQRLIVVSYWIPGSAHSHAACAIWRMRSRAGSVLIGSPVVTALSSQSRPSTTACMKSSVTRTELLAFWYWIEWLSRPSRSMSKPASRSTRALRSSTALHHTNSSTSGWSTLRITIFAARRVLPPDLIVPADASAPRMKLTGPDAVPPPFRCSNDERIVDRLMPAPEPPLKMIPSSRYQLRIPSIVSSTARMKHAEACCGTPFTPMLNHTGELKAARWWRRTYFSSSRNASASASSTKYPSRTPQPVIVSTTRSMTWRSDHSRSAVPSVPRKYFWATMLVALTDQVVGNSTPGWKKASPPSLKFGMRASRRSHSTVS